MWQMLSGKEPYEGMTRKEVKRFVLSGKRLSLPDFHYANGAEFKIYSRLIKQMKLYVIYFLLVFGYSNKC